MVAQATMKILSAEFLTTGVSTDSWPSAGPPEVAFAGRSNVGKSSMINALCQRHKLVRVSNTPGRTRTLNFFDVSLEDPSGETAKVRFCDLPGYGFSKVSKTDRRQWQEMIEGYLAKRQPLAAVVCIVDANVGPTEDDARVVAWVQSMGRRVIVAATKVDKMPKHRRHPRQLEIARTLVLSPAEVVVVSPKLAINLEPLWEKVLQACEAAKGSPAVASPASR